MNCILLILKDLAVFEEHNAKSDSFPEMVRIHEELADHCLVLSLRPYSKKQREAFESSLKTGSRTKLLGRGWHIPDRLLSMFIKINTSAALFRFYKIKYFLIIRAIQRYVNDYGKPDIMTALHSCDESGIVTRLINDRIGVPFVVLERKTAYAREKLSGAKREVICETLSRASLVLPVSQALGQDMKSLCQPRKLYTRTLPNPAAKSLFEPTQPHEEVVRFAQGRFVFAGWTNWRVIKRLDLLVDAFRQVKKQRPDICLVIAGRLPEKVWQKLPHGEWREHTLILGHIDRAGIRALATASNCCVIPSNYETFGLPAIEALSAGLPVITTRCGGPEEVITDSSLGRVVERGDSEALARAMLEVCDNKEAFDSVAIREHASSYYGHDKLLERWQDVYRTVLGEQGTALDK